MPIEPMETVTFSCCHDGLDQLGLAVALHAGDREDIAVVTSREMPSKTALAGRRRR